MYCNDDSDSDCECDYSSQRIDANATIPGSYASLDGDTMHSDPVFPRPELKIMDFDQVGNNPTNAPALSAIPTTAGTGNVVCLNTMILGASLAQAVGNQVTIKRVSYRYGLIMNGNGFARVMLVWDRQPNGVLAGFNDILDDSNQSNNNRNSCFSHLNADNRRRFVVLKDDNFPLPLSVGSVYNMSGVVPIDMVSTFVGSTVSRQIPQTGALLLVSCGFTATTVQYIGRWRVRYYDN